MIFWTRIWLILVFCSVLSCRQTQEEVLVLGLTEYVDPMIGTAKHGHVYPGATIPFGSVQLSPDNGTEGWDWCAGYNYIDSMIVGFSHTHLSGTGIGDLCDVLVMPTKNSIDLSQHYDSPKEAPFASTFSHSNEHASAGYYAVKLDNGIEVELTTSQRVGLHKYTFPEESGLKRNVIMDLGHHINWDSVLVSSIERKDNNIFAGSRHSTGWAKQQQLFYAITFSEIPSQLQVYNGGDQIGVDAAKGNNVKAIWEFDKSSEDIMVKVALSSASMANAIATLDEIPDWDFTRVRKDAIRAWNDHLGKIRVASSNEALLRTFYTALYRTALAPIIYEDISGQYKAASGQVVEASEYVRYDIFSLWDTFRAAHPLLSITQPDRTTDFIKSFLAHFDECGLLPVWSLLGNETNTMTGYHAIPIILDAYLKGHRQFDVEKAYEAMKKSGEQDIRDTDDYRKYGYIPYELGGQSVTKTLEYAFDDWCIAQMALLLGKQEEHKYFLERARNYQNLFDASTRFMRARMVDGNWKTPFNPTESDHNFAVAEYTEGNAWQHSWFVPHDVRGLISLHGGNDRFVNRLDSLFSVDSDIAGDNRSMDISGLIGQYAHGNEPSHHIPYLYNYAGAPWKGQEKIREILESQYSDAPDGLCGNEDCGQMSAWYVFSTLGFYPVNPAEGVYVIGTPMFKKATLDMGNGRDFIVRVVHLNEENKYIQSATLNELPLTRSYLYHYELEEGGELILEMGPKPNYLHWSDPEAYPPSMSDPDQ
ncbi:MAG: glycoside hydrolase family 92 protein [Saprospiraceae bacterium]|nr:glycoside hydrolase family 92 protein [Saprospiraceae bacterium]